MANRMAWMKSKDCYTFSQIRPSFQQASPAEIYALLRFVRRAGAEHGLALASGVTELFLRPHISGQLKAVPAAPA